jgi:hypothetical protein
MSIKKYFDVTSDVKSLAGTTAQKISSQVESVGYHEQQIVKEERYIPHADYLLATVMPKNTIPKR